MLAAKMLRVPMLTTYHTDFPAYVENLTKDARMVRGCEKYMRWFYGRAAAVFSRSGAYHFNLRELGVAEENLRTITPGINTQKFNPAHRDLNVWQRWDVKQPFKLLYVGRISVEKNLPLLAEAFKLLCRKRGDVALVVAGEGPYEPKMKTELAGLPAVFTGPMNDEGLGKLYASADLFVFPSRTDTLGQVVMEAQASGLPTLVSPEGGPREIIEPDVSGLVLNGTDAGAWTAAVDRLLDNPARRAAMSQAALLRSKRYDLRRTFDAFWEEHVEAIRPAPHEEIAPMPGSTRRD
jgi:glycosyltransferase involved in cell wall biosynthesis